MNHHFRDIHAFKLTGIIAPRFQGLNLGQVAANKSLRFALFYLILDKLDKVIFKQILVVDGWVISCEITLRWMSQGLTDDKSTLVQVTAWCR